MDHQNSGDADICICGFNDFEISTVTIFCRQCTRLWFRASERWVYDATTDPDYGKNSVKDSL